MDLTIISTGIKRRPYKQTSGNEREGNRVIRFIILVGRPQALLMILSKDELLPDWNMICRILKDFEDLRVPLQGYRGETPIMVDGTQISVLAVDLSDHEGTVRLAHGAHSGREDCGKTRWCSKEM